MTYNNLQKRASEKISTVKFSSNYLTAAQLTEKYIVEQDMDQDLDRLSLYSDYSNYACSPGADPDGPSDPWRWLNKDIKDNLQVKPLDFLWLELTPECNLQCIHCYADSNNAVSLQKKIKYEDWHSILESAYLLGCKKVQFIGGEPTVYPNLAQLIADARSTGYEFIEVFTNGTLLDDYLLETFQKFKVNLAFSVYASNADLHDAITGKKGSFEKTISGISKAVDCGLSIRIGIIAMEINHDKIRNTETFIKEKFGDIPVLIDWVRAAGRGGSLSQCKSPMSEFCGVCYQSKLCIDSSGKIFPCIFARNYQVGHIREGLQNVLEGKLLRDLRQSEKASSVFKQLEF